MTTTFKQTLSICGLSQQEAAEFLDVRPDTVKSWCSDRNKPPSGVWQQLGDLYHNMKIASDEAVGLIEEKQPDEVEFTSSGERGQWPSQRCALTVEAMVRLQI